jgi:hypothetical protein
MAVLLHKQAKVPFILIIAVSILLFTGIPTSREWRLNGGNFKGEVKIIIDTN